MADNITGAEALLRAMKRDGIDHMFVNPGSDYAPVIEAYAAKGRSDEIPREVLCPHENICVAMAHGYWLATGQMQCAAVHVNVGLANAAIGMLNALSDDVPVFLISGRNPLTEGDRPGGRRTPIQYGQEMFDQTALVREAVKWDYELRYAEQIDDLVARAAAIARMEPQGSVYLSLPREPLCEFVEAPGAPAQNAPAPMHPDPAAIRAAAAALAKAKNPLVICSRGDPDGQVSAELQAMDEENALPVAEVFVTRNVLPSDHPCTIGGNVAETIPGADVILVVDTPVAWIQHKVRPDPAATVIHLGPDPLFTRVPLRGYRTTHAIQTNTAAGLQALRAALPGTPDPARMASIKARHDRFRATIDAKATAGATGRPTKAYVAHCVSTVLGTDGVIFAERAGPASTFALPGPNRWFGNTQAGGLGWALPAALGAKLARRDRRTICVTGDGSYVFANPVACLQVALAEGLNLLTVVLNNAGYDAVRTSTLDVYPDGAAARANTVPMVPFDPPPDHAAIASAAGVYAETVRDASGLPAALDRAIAETDAGRPALLDVHVALDDGAK